MSIADIMAVMKNGQIEDVGPPARIYIKPQTRFTATFMGESNMFEGNVIERTGDQIVVDTVFGRFQVSGSATPGTQVHLSVRPEQITTEKGTGPQLVPLGKLKVEEVSFFGTHHRCQGRHAESNLPLVIRLPQNHPIRAGEKLNISVLRNDIVCLNR